MYEIWNFLMQGSSYNKRQGIRKAKRVHIGEICWGYRPCLRVWGMEPNILQVGTIHAALLVTSLYRVRCTAPHWATNLIKLPLVLIPVLLDL